MISPETVRTVARRWNLCLKTVRDDIDLYGSPERSCFRTAVEDINNRLYVLERIDPGQRRRRAIISRMLDTLCSRGLNHVLPYLKTPAGDFLVHSDSAWWQLSSYIPGTDLARPLYVRDAGKGEALACFLTDFTRQVLRLQTPEIPFFSLKDFVLKLEAGMRQHDPEVYRSVRPALDFLRQSFFDVHDMLPVAFCHGDFHPLNIIWQGDDIAAVIDWEFCGPKIDVYDVANLVGCVGMEHPSGLMDSLVLNFINGMRLASCISEKSRRFLPEAVVAVRFAWLSEWLRKNDKEMIALEVVYINLLVDNKDKLRVAWNLPPE